MNIGDLFWTLRANGARLQADVKKEGDKAGQTLGQSLATNFKKSFSGAELGRGLVQGLGLAGALGAANLVSTGLGAMRDAISGAITDASNLAETMTKSEEIFGEAADGIEKWAETAADSFGQSKRQAIDTASTFAGLFSTVGLALDDATGMAKELTELGSDLASFFNTDVQTAIDSLRSGLAGESEPLRKFNVFLSETAVAAKATELGMKKVNGKFTEGQKVTARYAIIMEQTAAAQGDFARTSDGLANTQRTLDAKLEDLSARIGEKLLPIVLKLALGFEAVLDAVVPVIEKIEELAGPVFELIEAYNLLNDAIKAGLPPQELLKQRAADAALAIHDEQQAAIEAAGGFDAWVAKSIAAGDAAGDVAGDIREVGDAGADAAKAVRQSARDILTAVQGLRDQASGAASDAAAALYDPIILEMERAETAEELRQVKKKLRDQEVTGDERKELEKRRQELGKTLIEQTGLWLTYGTKAEQINKLSAFLSSSFWTDAYEGAGEEQKLILDDWRATLNERLAGMVSESSARAGQMVDVYTGEIIAGKGPVSAATETMVSGMDGPMSRAERDARKHGETAGRNFASGLSSQQSAAEHAAANLAAGVGNFLKQSSPAKKGELSKGGGTEGWGRTAIELLVAGMRSQIADAAAAARDVAGGIAGGLALSPRAATFSLGSALTVPSAGRLPASAAIAAAPAAVTRINNINVPITGLLKARDPFDVADRLRRFADNGAFDPPEEFK